MDGLKRYVNDDRFRVDGDKNMRLLAFAFTIVFVWTGSDSHRNSFPHTRAYECSLIIELEMVTSPMHSLRGLYFFQPDGT